MSITRITEKLFIDIQCCVPLNPVCLKWIGTNGGWNFWVFGVHQMEGLTTTTPALFSKFNEDLDTMDTDSAFLTKSGVPEYTVGADNIPNSKLAGIKSLLWSPQVMMLMNPKTWVSEGEIWQTVRINPAKFVIRDTKSNFNKVEFIMQLMEINIQSQ